MTTKVSSAFSSEICAICWDFPAEVELKPCSHRVICRKCICLLDDKKCPLCKTGISNVVIQLMNNFCSIKQSEDKPNTLQEYDQKTISLEQEPEELKLSCSKNEEGSFLTSNSGVCSRETYLLSFESILLCRRVNEEQLKEQAYQVVVTGSEGVDTLSLVCELKELFPLQHDLVIPQSFLEKCDDCLKTYAYERITTIQGNKKPTTKVNLQDLVDICWSTKFLLPNVELGLFPVNLRRLSIWELLYSLRRKMGGGLDVVVLCCDAMYPRSFEELLCLDELLRDRYAIGTKRMWVVLNSIERKRSNCKSTLSIEEVENALFRIPMQWRPSDLLFMQPNALCKFWHRELMQKIVFHARSCRTLMPMNSIAKVQKRSSCCYM